MVRGFAVVSLLAWAVCASGCAPDRSVRCVPVPDTEARAAWAGTWPQHAALASAIAEVAEIIAARIDDPGFAIRSTEAWLEALTPAQRELPSATAAIERELGDGAADPSSVFGSTVGRDLAASNAALDEALRSLAERDPVAAAYLARQLLVWLDPEGVMRRGSP